MQVTVFGRSRRVACVFCVPITEYVNLQDVLLVVTDPLIPVVLECLAAGVGGTDSLHKTHACVSHVCDTTAIISL